MNWKRLLEYISSSVDQELLLRNEYLATENRILRNQIQGRLQLNDSDRITLAEFGKRLGILHILERHGLLPAPDRERKTSWREFIRSHTVVLAAVDFITAEVWTSAGLITYYVAHFHAERNHQPVFASSMKAHTTISPRLRPGCRGEENSRSADFMHRIRGVGQGKENVILFPAPEDHIGESTGPIQTRERLGGLLKFYYLEAA